MARKVPISPDGNRSLEEFGKILATFRFVILHHVSTPEMERPTHWDLMLEQPIRSGPFLSDEGLLTFEVPTPPEQWGQTTKVRQLQNHRKLYLDYEGPISNNRGEVTRVLEGEFRWIKQTPEVVEVEIVGSNREFQGGLVIRRLLDKDSEKRWEMQLQAR